MQRESVLGWHLCVWARQELECCQVYHIGVCCMSMICNVQMQESVDSPSVKKIVGLCV